MPELTIVVPTLDERENLRPLIASLEAVLNGIDFEILFVDDDSGDGTSGLAREIAQHDPRVRVVQRIGRRGLSSAVLEGMMASSAPYLAVMDSDLQHDEKILPVMLRKLIDEHLDLVIATRHQPGGGMGEMVAPRRKLSEWGRRLSSLICRTNLSDPMSGYFVVTRAYVDEVARRLSGTGFKVLLDLVVSARRKVRVGEVPYVFRPRLHGMSKLDILVAVEYLELLADKVVGDFIPATYVMFALAGAIGVFVHLCVVNLLEGVAGLGLRQAQTASSILVMGLNFVLNNQLTFRSARLRGRRFLMGLALFYTACSVGLSLNLHVLNYVRPFVPWYVAASAGLAVGSVWNYWVSSIFVWQVRRRSERRARPAAGNAREWRDAAAGGA